MKRIGDVLSVIFDDGMIKKARGYSLFFSCWKDLAEKNGIAAAADHSWIKSLERGLVWIEVDHPGWKQILQTKESKLLSDFRRRFPEMDISGISIMLSRPGAYLESTEDNSAVESAVPEVSPSLEDIRPVPPEEGYSAIKDESLKDALMKLEQNVAVSKVPSHH